MHYSLSSLVIYLLTYLALWRHIYDNFLSPSLIVNLLIVNVCVAIIEELRNLGWRFIDRSINEWRQRLQKFVEKQGEHIEHVF